MNTRLLPLVLLSVVACTVQRVEPTVDDQAVLGLGIRNAVVVDEHLVSSGQPSEAQLGRLAETGFTHVVQLRPADEEGSGWEEARAQELGLQFERIPVAGGADLTEANARALDAAIARAQGQGVLVSCASGNRVGGLLALRAHFCQGLAPEAALELGKKAGLTRAEPAVRAALGLPEAQ